MASTASAALSIFSRVHHRDHHGQVAREVEEAGAVLVALGAVAVDAAVDGGARHPHHAQALHDGVVERLALPLVGLTQEQAQHSRRAGRRAGAARLGRRRGGAGRAGLTTVVSCTSMTPSPPCRRARAARRPPSPRFRRTPPETGRCSLSTSILGVWMTRCAPNPAMARVAVAPETPFGHQERKDRLVERRAVMARVFVDENGHLLRRALL